jgi:glc operon protein GlcG
VVVSTDRILAAGLATALLLPGWPSHAQLAQSQTLDLYGARQVIQAAEQKAQELEAPSSIAVVDASGDLILFEQMPGARPAGIDIAIGKARSAARFQVPTQGLEATINGGRPAAITSGLIQMQGGVPIRFAGHVVGAIGISGFDREKDLLIADAGAQVTR